MKLLLGHKDGGPESKVWAYGIEIKKLFSVILLRFEDGSREAYHSHAFNCINWVLSGTLFETRCNDDGKYLWTYSYHSGLFCNSVRPFIIKREHLHKVNSVGRTYVLTLRGAWTDTWKEFVNNKMLTLTHGRKEV